MAEVMRLREHFSVPLPASALLHKGYIEHGVRTCATVTLLKFSRFMSSQWETSEPHAHYLVFLGEKGGYK